MNKLRILNDNTVLSTNASITSSIYKHQRIEHGAVTGTFLVGETVTGSVSGAKGGTITGVGQGYIDLLLLGDSEIVNFYLPNASSAITEVLTTVGGSATTILGYRIPVSHPDFPPTNATNPNRNLVVPAKGYFQLDERNFNYLSTTVVYTNPVDMSTIAILNHNFSDTAILNISYVDSLGVLKNLPPIVNPNQGRFSSGTKYFRDNQSSSLTASDRKSAYKNNNIFIMYLPSSTSISQIQVSVEDSLSVDPFTTIGNIYVGTFYELETNMANSWQISAVDTSSTVYAVSPYSVVRQHYHMLSFNFNLVTSNERAYWHDLFTRNGTHTDFIIDLFSGSTDVNDGLFSFYGRFANQQLGFVNDFSNRYSLQLQFRESI